MFLNMYNRVFICSKCIYKYYFILQILVKLYKKIVIVFIEISFLFCHLLVIAICQQNKTFSNTDNIDNNNVITVGVLPVMRPSTIH